jgi:hypothetical protein
MKRLSRSQGFPRPRPANLEAAAHRFPDATPIVDGEEVAMTDSDLTVLA